MAALGRAAAKCGPAARSRKGAAQRNLVRDTAQISAAQRLMTALRQDGSALRAESLRWTPDTLPLSLQGSGDVPRSGTLGVPGTCGGAALWGSGDVRRSGTLGRGRTTPHPPITLLMYTAVPPRKGSRLSTR